MGDNAKDRRHERRKRVVNPPPVMYAFCIMRGDAKVVVANADYEAVEASALQAKPNPTDHVNIWKYSRMGIVATV